MKQWAKTVISVAASLAALAAASGAHYLYSSERFAESPDGAWVADSAGFEWRLDNWVAQATWEDSVTPQTPGTSFIFVTASVRAPTNPPEGFSCSARLIGSDSTEWDVTGNKSGKDDDPMDACKKAAIDHQEVTIVLHYEVPAIWATPERIRGIAFGRAVGFAPAALLTTTHEG